MAWRVRVCPALVALSLAVPAPAAQEQRLPASGALARAQELYGAASYEQALEALAEVENPAEADRAATYQALCLLALGRLVEVERVLERLVSRSPAFTMSEAQVPPRLLAQFAEVRQRLLAGIVGSHFAEARAAFDRREHAEASARFAALVALLSDRGDTALREAVPFAEEIRALAEGYLTLIAAAEPPAAPPDVGGPPPPPRTDTDVVRRAVLQYAQAYSTLDVEEVARVFPATDLRTLRAAFGGLRSQSIDARDVTIAIDPGGGSARVSLTWAIEAVPRVGAPIRTTTRVALRLQRSAAGEWTIVERR